MLSHSGHSDRSTPIIDRTESLNTLGHPYVIGARVMCVRSPNDTVTRIDPSGWQPMPNRPYATFRVLFPSSLSRWQQKGCPYRTLFTLQEPCLV